MPGVLSLGQGGLELLDLGAIRLSLAAQLFEVRAELRLEALRFLDATRRISADGRLGRLRSRRRMPNEREWAEFRAKRDTDESLPPI